MAQFKTRARALDLLGRQQIAGIPTAINELIKRFLCKRIIPITDINRCVSYSCYRQMESINNFKQ